MTIFLVHGVVDEWDDERQTDRNYVGTREFEIYLRSRSERFVDLDALSNAHHVLTVDDSTLAGANACFLAKRLGHEVTFFVNPVQVVLSQPYFFSILDHLIDRRRVLHCRFRNRDFVLHDKRGVKQFRLAAKEALMDLPHAQANCQLQEIANLLDPDDAELPPHLAPVGLDTLKALLAAGVRIENHGWDHNSIRTMDKVRFKEHIARGKDWLFQELGVRSEHYAIPFGLPDITPEQKGVIAGRCFAASDTLESPLTSAGSFNRTDITGEVRRVR